MPADRIDAVVSLAKRRGFVFPSSEIYGGTRSAWDYGPLGVELKENVRRQWWRTMVQQRDDIVGLDSAVILARDVWAASGHLDAFVDPLTECQSCHKRFRADHLEEAYEAKHGTPPAVAGGAELPELRQQGHLHRAEDVQRPDEDLPRPDRERRGPALPAARDRAGHLRQLQQRGDRGPQEAAVRHRPGRQVASATRSPRATSSSGPASSSRWRWSSSSSPAPTSSGTSTGSQQRWNWYRDLGLSESNLRFFEHPKEKLSHYSKRTVDIEYRFQFGGTEFAELEGIANRTDFDLTTHSKHSGVDLSYFDQEKQERWVPYVIEPAAGLTRAVLAFLLEAYDEDEAPNTKGGVDKRTVMRFDPRLAPVKVAVLPLSRNPELSPKARELADLLRKRWMVEFDDSQAIGRRYRRQDEIGTPFCVTVDFDTLTDNAVTVRDRDTMKQERVSLDQIEGYLIERLPGCC